MDSDSRRCLRSRSARRGDRPRTSGAVMYRDSTAGLTAGYVSYQLTNNDGITHDDVWVVAEGFSPGVLDNWGLGYSELKKIKKDIIYVQQSGMGAQGTYGRFRTVGPIANA